MHNPELIAGQPLVDTVLANRDTWQQDIAARNGIDGTPFSSITEPLGILEVADADVAYNALLYLATAYSDDELVTPLKQRIPEFYEPTTVTDQEHKEAVLADPIVREIVNHRDLSDEHESLTEAWADFADVFRKGIALGTAQGFIPQNVSDRVEAALDLTAVRVVDPVVLRTMGGDAAYYETSRDEVGIADVNVEMAEIISHLIHEYLHKLSGGSFKFDNKSGAIARNRSGFTNDSNQGDAHRKHLALTEGVTEHLALGVETGDFEYFDPDLRDDDSGVYYGPRKAIAAFIDRSGGLVDAKMFTNAFFEDTDSATNLVARRKLAEGMHKSYAPGTLRKFDRLLEVADGVERVYLEETILRRIHPVEFGSDGLVIKKGYIDIEGLPTIDD